MPELNLDTSMVLLFKALDSEIVLPKISTILNEALAKLLALAIFKTSVTGFG